jgi:UMF1 family MFS transporter
MNDKREILGWTMYDWANSAFSTTVVTTFLGPYLTALVNDQGGIVLFGREIAIEGAAFFSFCVSLSVILQVFFLPLLGTIADYSEHKKRLLVSFAYAGSAATMLLFFVQGNLALLGGLLFILANLSFGAAVVFYNSFLPDITTPDQRDKISSRGFALGYLGGGLLLAVNLVLVQMMADTGLAVRLSLASAGVWWLVFTYLFPQQRLRQRSAARQLPPGENYFSQGFKQIVATFREMRTRYPVTLRYLVAYLIYNDGIQTVIAVATIFAAEELGVDSSMLALLVLLIQFVAFGGALIFGRLATAIGAKQAIMLSLVIWSALVIYTYAFVYDGSQIWTLGVVIALVLGGSQALSRSLYSQMIPALHEAEYFGFYEISERGTSWLGPLLFGLAVQFTGSQRIALVSLIIFFVLGLILLFPVNVRKAITDAGHDPEGVVL